MTNKSKLKLAMLKIQYLNHEFAKVIESMNQYMETGDDPDFKEYWVTYNGNDTKFKGNKFRIIARSEREAVEKLYRDFFDKNYFPHPSGCIYDCDGNLIADHDENTIYYDGGYFYCIEGISNDEMMKNLFK